MDSPNRYFLIATGVGRHEASGFDPLPKVRRDVWTVARIFSCDFGYERVLREVGLDPTVDQFRFALRSWLLREDSKRNDIVVVYFAGHAYVSNSLDHYLCFRSFATKDPRNTGLRPSDLAALFFEGEREVPENVWLILDSCYSGAGAAQAQQEASRLLEQARPDAIGGFWVLASARSNEGSRDGAFAPLFYSIVKQRLRDPAYSAASTNLLRPDGLTDELNRRFNDKKMPQRALLSATAVGQLFPFFPNRDHHSRMIGLDLETQRRIWSEKARGAGIGEIGDFFTGRTTALQQLRGCLRAPESDLRIRVVTGSMGSGKSAVLGRLVSTEFVDLALDARERTTEQVQGAIAGAVGVVVDDFLAILNKLRERHQSFGLVIDGLDEAKEPTKIARVLLQPLAAQSAVRLIVGTRRTLLKALGESIELLDLDVPPYWQPQDLRAYVERRLTSGSVSQGPNYSDQKSARLIASAVASDVGSSFLLARLATRNILRQKPLIDPSILGWEGQLKDLLPRTAEEAYEADFLRFGNDKQIVRDLLRPLAYAKGQGLPWGGIWGAVASQLAGRKYTTNDIERVQDLAGFYIVADNEQGASVYRLFHESLESFLKGGANEAEIERLFTSALMQTTDRREDGAIDWLSETRPYVRDYLALHASNAGMLGDIVQDPAYVAVANPDLLQQAMRRSREQVPPEIRSVHARVIHHLRGSVPKDALSYLEMAARLYGYSTWARRIAETGEGRNWDVPWMVWQAESPHQVIRAQNWKSSPIGFLYKQWSLEAGMLREEPVIFSGDLDGTLRVWNARTATPAAEPRKLGENSFTCMALFATTDRLFVFTAARSGGVDASDAYNPGWHATIDFDGYTANAVAAFQVGTRMLCACGVDQTICLWDPIAGETVGNPIVIGDEPVYAIGALETNETVHILAGGSRGGLYMWRLDAAEEVAQLLPQRHKEAVVKIGVARHDGKPLFVSIARDGDTAVWDADGKEINRFKTGHDITRDSILRRGWIQVATVGSVAGTNAIAAADFKGIIRILELPSGLLLRSPLKGHSAEVLGLTIGERDREPYVASSAGDGTIRVWEFGAPESATPRTGEPHMRSVAVVNPGDGHVAVVCGDIDGTISVQDLSTGAPMGRSFDRRFGAVNHIAHLRIDGRDQMFSASDSDVHIWDLAKQKWLNSWQAGKDAIQQLAVGELARRPVIASASHDASVSLWDVRTKTLIYEPIPHPDQVLSVTIAALGSSDLRILSGCFDRKIRIFDLSTGAAIGSPLVGHTGPVVSIAVGEWRGRRVIVSGAWDGTIRIWDAIDGKALGDPLAAHNGSVNSVVLLSTRGQSQLVSGGSDGLVHIWGFLRRPITSIDLDSYVLGMAAAGETLAVAAGKGVLALRLDS